MFFLSRVDSVASRNSRVMSFQGAHLPSSHVLPAQLQLLMEVPAAQVLPYLDFPSMESVWDKALSCQPAPHPLLPFVPVQEGLGLLQGGLQTALETHKGTEFFPPPFLITADFWISPKQKCLPKTDVAFGLWKSCVNHWAEQCKEEYNEEKYIFSA